MNRFFKRITLNILATCLLLNIAANAQSVLVGPHNGGDFELSGTASLIANGWNNVSLPTYNRWYCGTSATDNTTFAAYIRRQTSETTHNYYRTVSSVTHIWRDISFPAGEEGITLSFDWIGMGEPGFDRMKVYLVGTGLEPVTGTPLPVNNIGLAEYSGSNTWTTETITIPSYWAGHTGRLVFTWENNSNGIGDSPPAGIDNVVVTSDIIVSPPAPTTLIMPSTGSTTVNDCSFNIQSQGFPFNYADNTNSVYTICPSVPGTHVNIDFNEFGLENRRDFLFIYDGASTDNRLLDGFNGTELPPSVRASSDNASGCLTLKFVSNGSISSLGFDATVTCEATPGPPPVYIDNRDCYNASLVCSDETISGNNTGAGKHELFQSWIPCARTGEDEANWFYFTMATSGTVGMTIDPGAVDYDFAIWGPYSSLRCPVNTFDTPIRCSYSQLLGPTGMNSTATETSVGAAGDIWIRDMDVLAGEVYILYINNYSITSTGFDLSWQFSNGASLSCIALGVEFAHLYGEKTNKGNLISWETSKEENSNIFEVQRSLDGKNFETITSIPAAGYSNRNIKYSYLDENSNYKGYYYRVKEIDFNGAETFTNVIHIGYEKEINIVRAYPNPVKDVLTLDVQSDMESDVSIEIINSLGNTIYTIPESINKGFNTMMLNTNNLPSGLYIVKITNIADFNVIHQAFVKQ